MEPIDFTQAARQRQSAFSGAARKASSAAPAAPPADERRTFRFLIERYLQHHRRENHAPSTIVIYEDTLTNFSSFFEQQGWNTSIDDHPRLILEHARAWVDDLQRQQTIWRRPYSAATIHQYVRCARAFFNWLVEDDYVDFHYLAKLERPKLGEQLPRALADSQLNELLRQPEFRQDTYNGYRNLCLVLVYLDTWARLSEIICLPAGNMHAADGWAMVHGKGGRDRAVRFGHVAQEHLIKYMDRWRPAPQRGQDHFFLTKEGHNLSANAVKCMLARIRSRTGIPISAHRLRHTGATAGARQKMPLDDIRKKLGHTTPKATVGYIHLAEQMPSAEDQPSGLDWLNLKIPRMKKRTPAPQR